MLKFAVNSYLLSNFNAKKEARRVSTKAWSKLYKSHLLDFRDKFNTEGVDLCATCYQILDRGYGANIGEQILTKMTEGQMLKLKKNILEGK